MENKFKDIRISKPNFESEKSPDFKIRNLDFVFENLDPQNSTNPGFTTLENYRITFRQKCVKTKTF